MQIVILILSIISFYVGFEVLSFGGFISSYNIYIYAGYIFVIAHVFVVIGIYKKVVLAKKIFLGENLFFTAIVIYYIIIFPTLNFGRPSTSIPKPDLPAYLEGARYGLIPIILFIVNTVIVIISLRKKQKMESKTTKEKRG